jgi:hypothetical protein
MQVTLAFSTVTVSPRKDQPKIDLCPFSQSIRDLGFSPRSIFTRKDFL